MIDFYTCGSHLLSDRDKPGMEDGSFFDQVYDHIHNREPFSYQAVAGVHSTSQSKVERIQLGVHGIVGRLPSLLRSFAAHQFLVR